MYPKPIERLINHFQKLPGIGPKQGAKFAFKTLSMDSQEVGFFAEDLKNILTSTAKCTDCRIIYEADGGKLCPICNNKGRNRQYICVVETDRDAYTIEQSQAFNGVYHVLGEKISFSGESLSPSFLRPLEKRVSVIKDAEIVIAMNATPEGQTAALWLQRALEPITKKVTRLGRGLSSGIEIEYADKDTLVDAFQNRK